MSVGEPLPAALVLRDVEVDGRRADVRVRDGRVAAVAPHLEPEPVDEAVDGGGGALLPGLHDHHLHLRALAAALHSVPCGPPAVTDAAGLAEALRAAAPRSGWIRGVGYHESVAGDLDRARLDRLRDDVPVRVQHRSGILWAVNSRAAAALELDAVDQPGVERDGSGRATGRLWRMDAWLRERTPAAGADLGEVGRLLAERGVTGVTDATVDTDAAALDGLVDAVRSGAVPQRLHVLGSPGLSDPGHARVGVGPVKLVLDEGRLPAFDELVDVAERAHAAGRGVAVHAVARATLALTVAALRRVGPHSADRVEHASVCPPELAAELAALGATVVTQPNFVAERGERYRVEVAADDRPWLYPVALLDRAGVPVAAGSDAPFGTPDPWAAVDAATHRRTPDDEVLGPEQCVPATRALALFLGPLAAPAATVRRVREGVEADLCLLATGLSEALARPSRELVRATLVGGRLVAGPAG